MEEGVCFVAPGEIKVGSFPYLVHLLQDTKGF